MFNWWIGNSITLYSCINWIQQSQHEKHCVWVNKYISFSERIVGLWFNQSDSVPPLFMQAERSLFSCRLWTHWAPQKKSWLVCVRSMLSWWVCPTNRFPVAIIAAKLFSLLNQICWDIKISPNPYLYFSRCCSPRAGNRTKSSDVPLNWLPLYMWLLQITYRSMCWP